MTFHGEKKPGLGVKNLEQAGRPKTSCLTFLSFNLLIYYKTEIEKFGKTHSKVRFSLTFHSSDILPASRRKKPRVFPASHNPVSGIPFKRKPWDLTGTPSGSGPPNRSVTLGLRGPDLSEKPGCSGQCFVSYSLFKHLARLSSVYLLRTFHINGNMQCVTFASVLFFTQHNDFEVFHPIACVRSPRASCDLVMRRQLTSCMCSTSL